MNQINFPSPAGPITGPISGAGTGSSFKQARTYSKLESKLAYNSFSFTESLQIVISKIKTAQRRYSQAQSLFNEHSNPQKELEYTKQLKLALEETNACTKELEELTKTWNSYLNEHVMEDVIK